MQRVKKGQKQEAQLRLPNEGQRLLLHTCCAPCAGSIMEALRASEIAFTIFFYNPNIHPEQEYLTRKQENIAYAAKHRISFIDADYDADEWFERTRGLEQEPERGKRCTVCFDMRLERTALYAHEHGYPVFATSLGISRWKDMAQVYACGKRAAARYPGLIFWDYNWRKQGGSQRMLEISKEEEFYKQEYCGCIYSLRDSNTWRLQNGREVIKLGEEFYGRTNKGKLE